jgi:Zn-dependent protease
VNYQAPQSGYIATFNVAGVPTYIHWSFPVTGCLIAAFLGDWSTATVLSSVAAYALLVLAHEFGHAFFARRAKVEVHAMVITAGGGYCYAAKPPVASDRLLLYAGGLIAQVIILALSVAHLMGFGFSQSKIINTFLFVFTVFNAVMLVGNAIPHRTNDGSMLIRTIREMRNEA